MKHDKRCLLRARIFRKQPANVVCGCAATLHGFEEPNICISAAHEGRIADMEGGNDASTGYASFSRGLPTTHVYYLTNLYITSNVEYKYSSPWDQVLNNTGERLVHN